MNEDLRSGMRSREFSKNTGAYNGRISRRPRLTPERMDELRANNQCFICTQRGHLSRDCPTRTTVQRPPGIQAATINFRQMQAIDNAATDEVELQVSVANILENNSTAHMDSTLHCNSTTVGNRHIHKGNSHINTYPQLMNMLERNASMPKDFLRIVPKAMIIECQINGKPMRTLLDSGSLSDFISTVAVDQLKLKAAHLVKPIACQMAASGSRTMITSSVESMFTYQNIRELRRFDVINLENHDIILGIPFLWKHKVILGFNPARIVIGSDVALPLEGEGIAKISSMTADIAKMNMETL